MIHFQHYLYRHIGKRIRKYRIASGKNSIEKFANNMNDTYALPIDRVLLSNIENGKAIPGKNKYLFSPNLLDGFCTVLKTTREQLIFGDIDQKEQLIKLILLSLLMNGDKVADDTAIDDDNKALIPFIETGDSIEHYMTNDRHYILDQLFYSKRIEPSSIDEYPLSLENIEQFLSENYPFFSNSQFRESYLLLTTEKKQDFTKLSNLLLKLLFGSLDFATDFIERFRLLYQNQDLLVSEAQIFLQNRGCYGSLATDWINSNFYLFVDAFNSFWTRHKQDIMTYFEENLFDLNNKNFNQNRIMWHLTDEYFNELITSKDFETLLENLLTNDEYSEQTMIGHNHVRSVIQSALMIDPNIGYMNNPTIKGYDLNKLNSDMQSLTRFFEEMSKNNHSKAVILPLFASQYAKIQ